MKRMRVGLGYKCHPCTPNKAKEYGVPVVPDTGDIDPEGVSQENPKSTEKQRDKTR